MLLGELICTLGVGILAPQNCMTMMLASTSCNKHEQDSPVVVLSMKDTEESPISLTSAGQLGTGIEQPCKAVVTPGLDLAK